MKNLILKIFLFLSTVFIFSGCSVNLANPLTYPITPIYTTAVDTRDVKTIVNDKAIEADVAYKILNNKMSDYQNTSFSSYKGELFIVGEYESLRRKKVILYIAKHVKGVKRIKSYFLKKKKYSCNESINSKISTKLRTKLIFDKKIYSTNIHIKTIQCRVILWGVVQNHYSKKQSIKLAKEIKGVKRVKSFIKVKRKT